MTLPRVQPIIPIRRKEPFDDPGWLFEFKYDGFRGLCYLERGPRPPHLAQTAIGSAGSTRSPTRWRQLLDVEDAILDGEVIVCDATGRPRFYELLRHRRAPAYVAFDILWLNGADLRPLPLTSAAGCWKRSCGRIADNLRTALGHQQGQQALSADVRAR